MLPKWRGINANNRKSNFGSRREQAGQSAGLGNLVVMMKTHLHVILTLAITTGGTVALAGDGSEKGQWISNYKEKIEISYDDVKNITTVRLNSMQVYGEALASSLYIGGDEASFQASFNYSGRTLKAKPRGILISLTSTSEDWKYTDFRKLTALVDGKRFNLGPLEHVPAFTVNASESEKSDDYISQRIVIFLSYKSFLRIANGKRVQIKMGPREFELARNHFEALRDFAARMIPQ